VKERKSGRESRNIYIYIQETSIYREAMSSDKKTLE